MTVSEKIVQSTMLQAVARVAMALTLPIMLMAIGYLSALGNTVAGHTTDIALIQQEARAAQAKLDRYDAQMAGILTTLNQLNTALEVTRTDAGYLRRYVEELKREDRKLGE
jgi:branched-subunit amino acid permease